MRLPYRIATERLDLHAPDPAFALSFGDAAHASRERLLPWMPWAKELPGADGIVALVTSWRSLFDAGKDRHYIIVERDTGEPIGCCGSHPRVRGNAREVGYWIRSDRHGQGFATEAAAAVVRSEFQFAGLVRVDLYIEPKNEHSLGVATKLGFQRVAVLPGHIPWPHGRDRDGVLHCMRTEDHSQELPKGSFSAWDILGRPLDESQPQGS